ncbi:hypothetical protein ACLKA6_006398 [Drosophila palustris]
MEQDRQNLVGISLVHPSLTLSGKLPLPLPQRRLGFFDSCAWHRHHHFRLASAASGQRATGNKEPQLWR